MNLRGAVAAMLCSLSGACASAARDLEPPHKREVAPDAQRFGNSAWDNGWDERGLLMLGQRHFRVGAWPQGREQFLVGLELAGAPRGSLLELEIGLWASARGSFGSDWTNSVFGEPQADEFPPGTFVDESSSSSLELSIGARKELGLLRGALRPYVGLGVCGLQMRTWDLVDGALSDSVDGDVGLYGHTGLRFVFDGGGSLGFDLRAIEGTSFDLGAGGAELDGDYTQWALSFSFFL